jgi:hypothetical protein
MRESDLYKPIQAAASAHGARLWRNNCGAFEDETGRWIRYGLANESKGMNQVIKSGDLIGITPIIIMPTDVGRLVGVFTNYEVKPPGWHYIGTPREAAQRAFIDLVVSMGGIADFITGPEGLR